jgi:hypothetical protein
LGAYYRPIYQGTYDFTFSCDSCEDKTIENISVSNGQPKIVDVQLKCDFVGINTNLNNSGTLISITSFNKGVKISFENSAEIGIYNIKGKLVKLFPAVETNKKSIIWDGKDTRGQNISNGFYVIRLVSDNKIITKDFILNR